MRYMFRLVCFFLPFLILVGCQTRTNIVDSVPGREANEIVVLLQSKGIDAQKSAAPAAAIAAGQAAEQLWNISVPGSQITEALAILNQAGLPRVKGRTLLDLFGAQGLVPSDLQDRIRYQEGLSEQLASTIRKMDGIIDANVQITFPQDEESTKTLTASVYVKHRGILDNPNSLTITKIKRLVASAVPGLTPENVSVVSDRALYADITLDQMPYFQEREFVSIWGIIVAKESSLHFRLIFYAFIILLFLLACLVAWFFWKIFPVMQDHGGMSSLFKPEQYKSKTIGEETTSPEEEGEQG